MATTTRRHHAVTSAATLDTDTIVAIATPLGEGGLGVVRLSGSNALLIASTIFKPNTIEFQDAESQRLYYGWIKDGTHAIDEAVGAFFKAPTSYTGEDVIEISCHGSPLVLKTVVELCQKKGARLARPGEFTERRFLNGKIDLLQAEAVADLISAQSRQAGQAALSHLRGVLSARIQKIKEPLLNLLAHIEANLDFVEEDIPGLSKKNLVDGLKTSFEGLEDLLKTTLRGQMIREGFRVALVGKPNVGKSSLFNALLARDRAIVTPQPGTTRDVLEEAIQWDGVAVVFSDTAGLRPTKQRVEKEGVARTKEAARASTLILFVIDGSQALINDDKKVFAHIKSKTVVVVANKSDKGLRVKKEALKKLFKGAVIETSAKTGQGLRELKIEIIAAMQKKFPDTQASLTITNLRHIELLEKARKNVQAAFKNAAHGASEEALAIDVREALKALAALRGENVNDDLLNSIFSQFCIGK